MTYRLLGALAGCGALLACGGVPLARKPRASGQSHLLETTFAGQNTCNPKKAGRPFVVEWDATDMSSFESLATSDVVLVAYRDCELTILDRCKDDDVRGSLGAYRPVEWTSGALETIDIANEDELFTKLPLGAATLGGRVQAGEKFHMEYYVSGTRSATRDGIYRDELRAHPGCESATHFVYGYNLGAFALGSASRGSAEAGGSWYGFGAGGSSKHSRQADKKAGDLARCHGDSAEELARCRVPIRLTLREIQPGLPPQRKGAERSEGASAKANPGSPANPPSKAAAYELARAHGMSAAEKMNAGDGPGCLQELDAYDVLAPEHASTDVRSGFGMMRAQCLMVAGQCDAGKVLARRSFEAGQANGSTPAELDTLVEGFSVRYCRGPNLAPRDRLLAALEDMNKASRTKSDAATCRKLYDTIVNLRPSVKARSEDDSLTSRLDWVGIEVPRCFARAGDCRSAFQVFAAEYPKNGDERRTPAQRASDRKAAFSGRFSQECPNP